MTPKKHLFEFRNCAQCDRVHGFDFDNPRLCVYMVILAAGLGPVMSVKISGLYELLRSLPDVQMGDNDY